MPTVLSPWISRRELDSMSEEELNHLHVYQKNYDRLLDTSRKRPEKGLRTIADHIHNARHLLWDIVGTPSVLLKEPSEEFEVVRLKYAKSALCLLRRKMLLHLLQPKEAWDISPHQLEWKHFTVAERTPADPEDLVHLHPCRARMMLNRLLAHDEGDPERLKLMEGVLRCCAGLTMKWQLDDGKDKEKENIYREGWGVPVHLPNDRWRAEMMKLASLALKGVSLYVMKVFRVEDEKEVWVG
ncbi:hypothetical protein LTR95_010329 [Oleoguttula sp. CCFEE 5521]